MVLGWDHAVLLRKFGSDFYVQRIFRFMPNRYPGGGGGFPVLDQGDVVFACNEIFFGWEVYSPDPDPTQEPKLRRLTTYAATSCSVVVHCPKDDNDHIIVSHMDSFPPIPLGVIESWRRSKSSVLGCSNVLPQYRVLASIAPSATEIKKFEAETCMDMHKKCSVETLLLSRGSFELPPNVQLFPEAHSQAGLVFGQDGSVVLRGYLILPIGYDGFLPAQSLDPASVSSRLGDLERRIRADELLVEQRTREMQQLMNDLMLLRTQHMQIQLQAPPVDPLAPAAPPSALENSIQTMAVEVRSLGQQIELLEGRMEEPAKELLDELKDNDFGNGTLHERVYKALVAALNPRRNPNLAVLKAILLHLRDTTDQVHLSNRTILAVMRDYPAKFDIPITPEMFRFLYD